MKREMIRVRAPALALACMIVVACGDHEPTAPTADTVPMSGVAETHSTPVPDGRMTGGGTVVTEDLRLTHGFQLRCDADDPRQNLRINWRRTEGRTNSWHLEELTAASCTDDPGLSPHPSTAPFDTYSGIAVGRYNGDPGALAMWTFTDEGRGGQNDRIASLTIRVEGRVVLNMHDEQLTSGNHRVHKSTGGEK